MTAFLPSRGELTRGEKWRTVLENITRESDKSQPSGGKMTVEGHNSVESVEGKAGDRVSGGNQHSEAPSCAEELTKPRAGLGQDACSAKS